MRLTVVAITPYERFMAVKDRFSTGGSTGKFVFVVGLLLLMVLLLALISTLLRRWQKRKVYNPKRLFLDVLRTTPLTVPQRDLVRRIARDLRLPHPAILLLSPRIFTENANAWMSASRNANTHTRDKLSALATSIFGTAA